MDGYLLAAAGRVRDGQITLPPLGAHIAGHDEWEVCDSIRAHAPGHPGF